MLRPRKSAIPSRRARARQNFCSYGDTAFLPLEVLEQSPCDGHPHSYASLLDACAARNDLPQGLTLHARIAKLGLDSNVLIGNRLVSMYLSFGLAENAQRAFYKMPNRGPVPWTTMIGALARGFFFHAALTVFHSMLLEGVSPDGFTLVSVISVCANLEDRESPSRLVFSIAVETGRDSETVVGTALVWLLPDVRDARKVFERVSNKDVKTWNAMMEVYMRRSEFSEVARLFQEMDVDPDRASFAKVLNACTALGDMERGRIFHEQALGKGFHADVHVEAAVFDLYSNTQNLDKLFGYAAHRGSVVLWTRRMAASTKEGDSVKTLECFRIMQLEGNKPDRVTLLTLVDALDKPCFLDTGKMIHSHARELGLGELVSLMNAFMNMYARCGSLEDAIRIFEEINRDLVSWNTLVGAYVQFGFHQEAFDLYHQMHLQGIRPDKITFLVMLPVCTSPSFYLRGKLIHACISEIGGEAELANAIMAMYGRCGSMEASETMFRSALQQRPGFWNSRIATYTQDGRLREALGLYNKMLLQGVVPDRVTFLAVCNIAATLEAPAIVKSVHCHLIQGGYAQDAVVATTLLDTYSKCGKLDEARSVFDKLRDPNVVSWTAMISAYGQHGFYEESLWHFRLMQLEGEPPNKVTLAAVLTARSRVDVEEVKSVRLVYECCIELGLDRELLVGNAALNVYSKLRDLAAAREVFSRMWTRSVVSWNSILAAYSQAGDGQECRRLFQEMQLESDSRFDKFTLVTVLGVCDKGQETLRQGRVIHQLAVESSSETDLLVGTALVHMYSTCGSLEGAVKAFENIQQPDTVSWNAMISTLSHHGEFQRALDSFQRMKDSGVSPDRLTFVAVLNACTAKSELELGQQLLAEAVRSGFGAEVAAAGINLFGKCGKVEAALGIFVEIEPQQRSLLAWNGLVTAFAHGGRAIEVIQVLRTMQLSGINPDSVTFVSLLSTLSHAGLVEACCFYLSSMRMDHGLAPATTHYCCVIDVLGRAGLLRDAEEMVAAKLEDRLEIACSDGADCSLVVLWTSFLAACGMHGDSERGKRAVDEILECQPDDAATYVVLSNMTSSQSLEI